MHLELRQPDRAEMHFRGLRTASFSHLPHTADRRLTLAMLSWVAAEIGSIVDARALQRQIRPYRELLVVLGTAAPSVCAGPMTFPLAMLETRLGYMDAALGLLQAEASDASGREVGKRSVRRVGSAKQANADWFEFFAARTRVLRPATFRSW